MVSFGSLTHPVMPARPSEAPMTLRNPRRETVSSHSEAFLGNSRCRASWNSGEPASSSSDRQYCGPVFSRTSWALAASIFSRTKFRSSFLPGQMSRAPLFLSFVIPPEFGFLILPPLRGCFVLSFAYPRLPPGAVFFRRFAAGAISSMARAAAGYVEYAAHLVLLY